MLKCVDIASKHHVCVYMCAASSEECVCVCALTHNLVLFSAVVVTDLESNLYFISSASFPGLTKG